MSRTSVSLFGKLSVRRERNDLAIAALKAQELLCFLLVHPARHHSREAIATALWGDIPAARSRPYLRKALWQLQSALSETDASEPERLLEVHNEDIAVNRCADLWVDAAALESALGACHGTPGSQMAHPVALELQNAVDLYQGDLLEGWYQDWCLIERERYEVMYLAALDKLMSYSEAKRDFERGIEYGFRILKYDRAREHTHRAMMRLHYLAGDRTAAIRQYRRCLDALKEELDVSPSTRTLSLYERIRDGSSDSTSFGDTPVPESPVTTGALQALLTNLQQIESAIHVVRVQLSRRFEPPEQH